MSIAFFSRCLLASTLVFASVGCSDSDTDGPETEEDAQQEAMDQAAQNSTSPAGIPIGHGGGPMGHAGRPGQ